MVTAVSLGLREAGITVSGQCIIFLISLLLGAALGVFYDIFRVLRKAVPTPAAVIAGEDILFFTAAAIISFGFMLRVTFGQIRWFILLGELLGWLLYYLTIGELVMKLCDIIIGVVKGIVGVLVKIFRFLVLPWLTLLKYVSKNVKSSYEFSKKSKEAKKALESTIDSSV